MNSKSVLLSLMLFVILAGCNPFGSDQPETQVTLNVSAAASLSDVLQGIETEFETEHPSVDVVLNLASSGTLQRQIEQGAPADLFLSASVEKFEALRMKGLLDEEYTNQLLKNQLVLVTQKDRNVNLADLNGLTQSNIERIAIGVPASVPAGRYAKETLKNVEIWNTIENKMVYAKDVRQVLTYVETGNVDFGFVYATDANVSNDVKIIQAIESSLHTPIVYPVGIIQNSRVKDAAISFYTFLKTEEVQATFKDYGFSPTN
ncbi:molybdate ABC transporter substrate-binding protein [Alkalihalobacillus sp. AL-G]|uniref:molybdate ABC transporter substrate-binding protein n=1 Tax=Alkalihalobacillus sp. AL-G TaxID=2926399 RepID=UPI00272B9444|nr:molybdate ABC transporter substrate-binding protein [Alkalihalobacillus sp. AL-G]WLD94257.1 molybdate ABC transporter substrate-binding protein [Alkalihalobacillus sp. AL-G]